MNLSFIRALYKSAIAGRYQSFVSPAHDPKWTAEVAKKFSNPKDLAALYLAYGMGKIFGDARKAVTESIKSFPEAGK